MAERLCWYCQHFNFYEGEPGFSEYTPGWDSYATCQFSKSSNLLDYPQEANKCPAFEWHESIVAQFNPEG